MSWWQERRFTAMGSPAHLVVGGADEALVAWAVEEVARLEARWSRFRPDSEVSTLNRRAGRWTAVSTPTFEALRCARRLWAATGGRFDPTVLGALTALGYDRPFPEVPADDPTPLPPVHPAPGFGEVVLDEAASAVLLPAGSSVDLGGIGKGLAADRVATGLVDRGAEAAVVALGGDVRAAGAPSEPWPVPVEHPLDEDAVLVTVPLTDGAVVTSTRRFRAWRRAGRSVHHLIDPATGRPAGSPLVAVVVHAPEAWWAEGLAKAALIAGPDTGPTLLAASVTDAWLVDDAGVVTIVEGSPCSSPC